VDKNFYGCASYKQGGLAACSNTARIKRQHVEDLLLKEIMAELLSDEAVAIAQAEIRAELRSFGLRQTVEPPSAKLKALDAQADELRRILKAGKLAPTVAQAALDTVARQRAEASSASRYEHKAVADVVRLLPQAVRVYRDAARNLSATLSEPEDRAEARALIGDLIGGRVVIRQEGKAVYAQLTMHAAALLSAAANSGRFNDFKCGSGGTLCEFPTIASSLIWHGENYGSGGALPPKLTEQVQLGRAA
jgi:hypothetical protein